jgi:hypothetical protein
MSAVLSGHRYDVLNVVVLKQMATEAAVAEATGLEPADVSIVLADLAERGLLLVMGEQAFPGEAAPDALTEEAAARFAAVRQDPAVLDAVERFEDTNTQLLATMTRWQTVEVGGQQLPNDHSDATYDDRIIQRVERLVRRLDPLLDALAVHDHRFGLYRTRFERALDAVDRGGSDFVSSPLVDSVHTVWFEFHEDLLRTLGRRRTE